MRILLILQSSFLNSQTVNYVILLAPILLVQVVVVSISQNINTCIEFLFHHTHTLAGLLESGLDDESTTKVIGTAINIMASMKGDWTQV